MISSHFKAMFSPNTSSRPKRVIPPLRGGLHLWASLPMLMYRKKKKNNLSNPVKTNPEGTFENMDLNIPKSEQQWNPIFELFERTTDYKTNRIFDSVVLSGCLGWGCT
uniref:Uncharacterized protein n=2 Tax=Cacopsylla melanoneura TaxID=428564 RepID=A0A8D8WGL3_9HEMI